MPLASAPAPFSYDDIGPETTAPGQALGLIDGMLHMSYDAPPK